MENKEANLLEELEQLKDKTNDPELLEGIDNIKKILLKNIVCELNKK